MALNQILEQTQEQVSQAPFCSRSNLSVEYTDIADIDPWSPRDIAT